MPKHRLRRQFLQQQLEEVQPSLRARWLAKLDILEKSIEQVRAAHRVERALVTAQEYESKGMDPKLATAVGVALEIQMPALHANRG